MAKVDRYRRTEGLLRDIPALSKDEDVSERNACGLGLGREHAEAGRVNVVAGNASDKDELAHVVFVRNVAGWSLLDIVDTGDNKGLLSMPRNDIERRVALGTGKEFTTDPRLSVSGGNGENEASYLYTTTTRDIRTWRDMK